jgi:hypothetical protein
MQKGLFKGRKREENQLFEVFGTWLCYDGLSPADPQKQKKRGGIRVKHHSRTFFVRRDRVSLLSGNVR